MRWQLLNDPNSLKVYWLRWFINNQCNNKIWIAKQKEARTTHKGIIALHCPNSILAFLPRWPSIQEDVNFDNITKQMQNRLINNSKHLTCLLKV